MESGVTPLYWDEVGEASIVGPNILQQTAEKIVVVKQLIEIEQSRQKSYADTRRRELQFKKGDKVYLKVSPFKGVMRFEKRGKLNPHFVGPFPILKRIGTMAYRLQLPASMEGIHDVFHVSMLRKCVRDPSHVVETREIEVQPTLAYEEKPVRILESSIKVLRNKEIPLVKVLWRNHNVEEATLERQ